MAGLDEAAAYRRLAAAVDAAAQARHEAAARAQRHWRGPAREDFDERLASVQAEAADLAAEARRLAAAIERAVEEGRGG